MSNLSEGLYYTMGTKKKSNKIFQKLKYYWYKIPQWVKDIFMVMVLVFAIEARGTAGGIITILFVISVFAAIPVYRMFRDWDNIKAQIDMVRSFSEAEKIRRKAEKQKRKDKND